jgi:hypothetical protein
MGSQLAIESWADLAGSPGRNRFRQRRRIRNSFPGLPGLKHFRGEFVWTRRVRIADFSIAGRRYTQRTACRTELCFAPGSLEKATKASFNRPKVPTPDWHPLGRSHLDPDLDLPHTMRNQPAPSTLLLEIEARQNEVLLELDHLNERIEHTLAEVLSSRTLADLATER